MGTRPIKWQRIVKQYYANRLLQNMGDEYQIVSHVTDWREHQAGIVVTIKHLDTGLDLPDGDDRDVRQENYLIPWRTVAQIALELQDKPPRRQSIRR